MIKQRRRIGNKLKKAKIAKEIVLGPSAPYPPLKTGFSTELANFQGFDGHDRYQTEKRTATYKQHSRRAPVIGVANC